MASNQDAAAWEIHCPQSGKHHDDTWTANDRHCGTCGIKNPFFRPRRMPGSSAPHTQAGGRPGGPPDTIMLPQSGPVIVIDSSPPPPPKAVSTGLVAQLSDHRPLSLAATRELVTGHRNSAIARTKVELSGPEFIILLSVYVEASTLEDGVIKKEPPKLQRTYASLPPREVPLSIWQLARFEQS